MKRKKIMSFLLTTGLVFNSLSPFSCNVVIADELAENEVLDEADTEAEDTQQVSEEADAENVDTENVDTKAADSADETLENVEKAEEVSVGEVSEETEAEPSGESEEETEAVGETEKKVIAKFDFNNLTEANAAISGEGAKAEGNYAVIDDATGKGKAVSLNVEDGKFKGLQQFLSVTDNNGGSLMTGLDAFTISYETRQINTSSANWPIFLNRDGDSPEGKQNYIGTFLNAGGQLNVERYCNNNRADGATTPSATLPTTDWVHVDIVEADGYAAVYKNGKLEGVKEFEKDFFKVTEILGDSSIFNVGKATWGGGEYFGGYIDNLTVYNYALSQEDVAKEYDEYKKSLNAGSAEASDSLDMGYVYKDFALLEKIGDKAAKWSAEGEGITIDGYTAKVERGAENRAVTLKAVTDEKTYEYKVVVLKAGSEVASYTISNPIEGQNGGMVLAVKDGDTFKAIHSNQPVMYTAKGGKKFVNPVIFRKADGKSLGMAASESGSGKILVYDTDDLISYTNETYVDLEGVGTIENLDITYDLTDERYELYVEDAVGRQFMFTSANLKEFTSQGGYAHKFIKETNAAKDALSPVSVGVTKDEYDGLVKKFTNPSAEKVNVSLTKEITVNKGTDLREELEKIADKVTIQYSNGDSHEYGVHFNQADINRIESSTKGVYTLKGYIGGDSYIIDADDPLIPERADPYITYDSETGYYYFTASYPMYGSNDKDGYDRLVLRRAKTVNGLATAPEISIWDENSSATLGRFIWAPEIHKINGNWYFVATAGLNSGTGTSFTIRPFMIKFNGTDMEKDFINPEKWGEPTLVKAHNKQNILNGMSLDMTYFEANGHHYLVWPDETINDTNKSGISSIYIAETDPDDPTQLISEAKLLTEPEYNWERVRYSVNEGPAVIKKDGKIYICFSAAGTGSEYCVGYTVADENADLLDMSNWKKNPYPILTSGDFDNKLSGPGHNSFTVNAKGEPIIVFHARPAAAHAVGTGSHAGDPLYDPCRSAYIRPVFFDSQNVPILNLSDKEFAGADGSEFEIKVTVKEDSFSTEPVFEYKFDEKLSGGKAVNSVKGGVADAIIHGNGSYVQDSEYGQVLYLDGDESYAGSNSYLELPAGCFDGKDNFTLSMDVNEVTRNHNYFTFAVGKDQNKYMFAKVAPTSLKAAITKDGSSAERVAEKAGAYPNNTRDWINVKIVLTKNSLEIYRNGVLFARTLNTGVKLSDLGTDLVSYIGKSFYSGDIYFRGYFDNIKLYEYAMSPEQIKADYTADEAARAEMLSKVSRVSEMFEIPNADNIRGNITLPSEKDGVKITWTSSDENVISTKEVPNANYDSTPAGVVTRQAADKKVTLTAVFSKEGQEPATKKYEVTVKAKPSKENDYKAYLFVHFFGDDVAGNGGSADREQTYFSSSRDGFNWVDLNDNKPVLKSVLGENGVRDHYIGRSAEGDKFYMIATDLSIYHGDSWGGAGSNGSHSIVVWESEDLVNWSEPWLAEIGPWLDENDNPGCTWAPEFIYDEKTGEYVVYFSSTHLEADADGKVTQDYENHSIYYCKTRDFRNFTESKLYHSGGTKNGKRVKVIDSTMIKDGNTYYRYTKNESIGNIEIDKSDSVLGEFTSIPSDSLSKDVPASIGAVEGPIIYKLNEKDASGKDQWCLLVDRFARAQGYYPLVTNDLSSGNFKLLPASGFSMPTKYRHGYVMSITQEEYERLNTKWGDKNVANVTSVEKSKGNPMLGFDADGQTLYGGDPSILVDGDTVYAYVGQDTSTNESYNMPDWKCYSSKDMKNWTYESTILTCDRKNVTWAADNVSAWAGQVVKYKDKYYFYFCTETTSNYGGGKSIGVAVSDSPKGPFKDIGHPLVRNIDTDEGVSTWEDIDPTFWIETDEKGIEHRVLGWGNSRFFNCELNEDMISVMDKDGNPEVISAKKADDKADADIKVGVIEGLGTHTYTEAPYYYRQQDASGKYFGKYYMFFATDWREQMAYAYADTLEDFLNNKWKFGGVLMEPSATANTNHMAVFDFKGQTYFVYHDGSLAHGSGFRRVACVEEMAVNSDGTIDPIRKTATGLTGKLSTITDAKGNFIAAKTFTNTLNDSDYPMTDKEVIVDYYQNGFEAGWEINPGKIYKALDEYVSIESDYKPGMYLSAGKYNANYAVDTEDAVVPVFLAQDVNGTNDEATRMTFRTLKGLSGSGVTFESVRYPGFYLANRDGKLILAKNATAEEATFDIKERKLTDTVNAIVQKTKRMYAVGQKLDTDDIRVMVKTVDGYNKAVVVRTDAANVDMGTAGEKELKVTYKYNGESYSKTIKITVVAAEFGR